MVTWISDKYVYRRGIELTSLNSDIQPLQPATIAIPSSVSDAKKVRVDFGDLEIVYNNQALYRDVIVYSGAIYITFQIQSEILANTLDANYFLYMGNPDLATPLTRNSQQPASYYPDVFSADSSLTLDEVPLWAYWPNRILYDSTLISYTRPGEHWIEGYTQVSQARASTKLIADRMRLICEVGPNQGIIQVRTNTDQWHEIDLYADTVSVKPVFEVKDLPSNKLNELTIIATGRSRYPSQEFNANVQMIDYSYDFYVEDAGEEVRPLSWSSYVGGV